MFYTVLESVCVADDETAYDLSKESKFVTTPYADYYELRNRLIECIPNVNIRLKTAPRTGKLEFSTDVNSVFDIAWYTFARILSEELFFCCFLSCLIIFLLLLYIRYSLLNDTNISFCFFSLLKIFSGYF